MISEVKRRVVRPREVLVVDSFLRASTCKRMLEELEDTHWSRSGVSRLASGHEYSEVQANFRDSASAQQLGFGARLKRAIKRIEKRLSEEFKCDPAHLEEWQATRYKRGEQFKYHLDGGHWKDSTAGDRKRTYLIYLDAPEKGGETHFRALNTTVAPKAGRLVVWNNLLPTGFCDHAMIHSGLEVKKGTKTTLVTWERERATRQSTRKKGR